MAHTSDPPNESESAWPNIREWLRTATKPVEVLPAESARAREVLSGVKVTTSAPLGAVAAETGGILIDHSWLRILGSGHSRLRGDLLTWNGLQGRTPPDPPLADALVVAHDAVGGFFALNGGAFAGPRGTMFYLPPDTLEWEGLGMSYGDFIRWTLQGDLASFFQNVRWPGWEAEVERLAGDDGISVYPFMFASGSPVGDRQRRVVPMSELWHLHRELGDQVAKLLPGTEFEVRLQ